MLAIGRTICLNFNEHFKLFQMLKPGEIKCSTELIIESIQFGDSGKPNFSGYTV